MVVPLHLPPVTRRVFLSKSLKGATALVFPGLVLFAPQKGTGANRSRISLDIPSPQFPAWAPGGRLLVSFISKNGSYGFLQNERESNDCNKLLSVGTAIGQFNWPQGIAVDGSIAYIVDSNNGRVQRFNLDSQAFLSCFGGLGKRSGLLMRPRGVCFFQNELFIADTRNHRVQVFSIEGEAKRVIGELGDADGQFRLPSACAVSGQREVFVVDSRHALIKVFGFGGGFLYKFGGLSSSRKEPGRLNMPTGIAIDAKKNIVYVADTGNNRIQAFDTKGNFLTCITIPGVEFKAPQGLAISEYGDIAVADSDADKVWILSI
jgi:tripartite motif-containing protein 71